MYGALWRVLPGGTLAKTVQYLVLMLAVLAMLWFVAFPWLEPRMPWNDVTISGTPPSPTATPTASPSSPATRP